MNTITNVSMDMKGVVHLGFTGTREGMRKAQYDRIKQILSDWAANNPGVYAHHGCCEGADYQFHQVVDFQAGLPGRSILICLHPPEARHFEAKCHSEHVYDVAPRKKYLLRNKDIVDASDLMLVTPKETCMQVRSGTWSTYRYAQQTGVPTLIIFPDGSIRRKL